MFFKSIKSGIESIDKILNNIRLGDNVVMQVTRLDDFKKIAQPFVAQAIAEKRNVNYIRFAGHEPVLEAIEGLKIRQLDASLGFEAFTVKVREIIKAEGVGAFYVFDCLSDLQEIWSTDLMMGNFFCVTCPYLFRLDTVAYFPIMRGHHDYNTIARIQETTQILLDIHSDNKNIYLHPIKVWNRYSPEMYLPHKMNAHGEFISLINGVELSAFYKLLQKEKASHSELNIDSYDRFIRAAKASYQNHFISETTLNKLIFSIMTHDKKMAELIKKEFAPPDYFFIKDRIIGTGIIGGKAAGMLLARKIIENKMPGITDYIESHDSFYIGTDVFYSYIVENNLWELRIEGRSEENYFSKGEELYNEILRGHFSEPIRAQFRRMLEYFGQLPIIVRSSSFLEDGFDGAFAGKYDSVFCVSFENPEERLKSFEMAVRQVYASTVNPSALEYKRKKGKAEAEEQMAILVQRVSGTKFDDYYMPCAAGVGFSYSIYRWSENLKEDSGFLRLVAGLGTRAVDRTGDDYPRLVNLDRPDVSTLVSDEEKHRFSQRKLDVIHTQSNALMEVDAATLIPRLPVWYVNLICEHDYTAEGIIRERGLSRPVQFISCQGIVQNKLIMSLLRDMLAVLQKNYGTPVDIEYTININQSGDFTVNLLQCRPLFVWQSAAENSIPEITEEKIFFRNYNTFMGNSSKIRIDIVVYIDSNGYFNCQHNQKSAVAGIIGQINRYYKGRGLNLMLVSPGRIGTSSPELGIPVTFSDISNFKVLCEYEDAKIGFTPELSYGSHMFQDLVESEMFYVAILDGQNNVFRKDFWNSDISELNNIMPSSTKFADIIKVINSAENYNLCLYTDFKNKVVSCGNFASE